MLKYVITPQEVLIAPVMLTILWMATDTPVMQIHRHSPVPQNLETLSGTRLRDILKHGTEALGFLLIAQQVTTQLEAQPRVDINVQAPITGITQIVFQIVKHSPAPQNQQTLHGTLFQATLKHGPAVHGVR